MPTRCGDTCTVYDLKRVKIDINKDRIAETSGSWV
jgi:hypothetical protein